MKVLDFCTSLKPFLHLSRIFGIFPFEFDFDQKINFKLSNFWILYSIFQLILPISSLYAAFDSGSNLDVLSEVWRSLTFVVSVATTGQIIYQIVNGNKIVDVILSVQKFDKLAMRNGIFFEYHKERKCVVLWIFSLFLMTFYCIGGSILSVYAFVDEQEENGYVLQMVNAYQMVILYFYVIQFSIYLKTFKKRFEKINSFLKFTLNKRDSETRMNEK